MPPAPIPRILPARHQALLGALEELFPLSSGPASSPPLTSCPSYPRFPPQALLGALEELFPLIPAPAPSSGPRYAWGRHVLIEYILLAGVNDADEDARRLLQLTRNIR